MTVLFLSLVTMCYIFPVQALAIINAEDLDLSMDDNGVAGKMDFSVSGSSGNSDKMSSEASGHLIWRHAQHLEMLAASINYGKSSGVRDTNKSFVHFRHRYAWNEMWGLEAFTQAQQNEFAHLKLRTLFGAGGRWSYQSHGLSMHVGVGSFYEREVLRVVANIAPVTRLWRGNAYLALGYAFDERIRIQNTIYYQPAWKNPGDYRLLNDTALNVALNDRLDLKLVIEAAQDSQPPAGVNKSDVSYKTGLSFRF
ncbi:DUF481 domain-containing protein [Mariprofundus sp. EBB-1]|nr:DUF481 domain-containing protein [Mariprofundus sp. EBB-1]